MTDTHREILKAGTDWSVALCQSVFGLLIRSADPLTDNVLFSDLVVGRE